LSGDFDPGSALDVDPARKQLLHLAVLCAHTGCPHPARSWRVELAGSDVIGHTLQLIVSPSVHDGLTAPALRFGDQRVMALLSCLCAFHHLFAGITKASLRALVAGLIPGYSARQMPYDLRRLRRKGLIRRIPKTSATS
jgi:hypothetical protein